VGAKRLPLFQAEKFGDVVRGVAEIYPGDGRDLFMSILKEETVLDELKGRVSAPFRARDALKRRVDVRTDAFWIPVAADRAGSN